MRGAVVAVGVAAAVATVLGADPGPARSIDRGDTFETIAIEAPGRWVAWSVERSGTARAAILALIRADSTDDPSAGESVDSAGLPPCPGDERDRQALFAIRVPLEAGDPEVLRRDVPADAAAIVGTEDDAGRLRREIDRPDRRVVLGEVEADDAVALVAPGVRAPTGAPQDTPPIAVDLGALRTFRPLGDGTYAVRDTVDLALDAAVRGGIVRVGSAAPRWVGRGADGSVVLASPAVPFGDRRMRVDVVRIPAGDRPASREECWVRLPGAEELLESAAVLIDGEPMLLATTRAKGRLGLFDEKLLRVFPLKPDRGRLGHEPRLAVSARMNLWQDVSFEIVDVDGDGREDVVLGYWKGLRDDRVVLDVHFAVGDGSFRDQPATTAFDVSGGDRAWLSYGGDVDGDGRPDLLVRSRDRLLIYRGTTGRRVVEREPVAVAIRDWKGEDDPVEVTVAVGTGGTAVRSDVGAGGRPYVSDLDGDGADDVVLPTPKGLAVVRLGRDR